jgi:hypothetical protein
MEEWTDRLRHRRGEILARVEQIGFPKQGTRGFIELPDLHQELVAIEQTLAQVESTEALRRDTAEREADRLKQDDAAYWWRRFNTSLAIGNGAGLAVVTGATLQAQHLDQALVFAWEPMLYFGPGVLLAGVLPWLLWAQKRYPGATGLARVAGIFLTTLAAGLFALGIGSAVYRVNAAQDSAAKVAKAERQVEGTELAKRWKAAGLSNPTPSAPKK